MPDIDVTLKGKDESGDMWKSATKNTKEYIKELEKLLGFDQKMSDFYKKRAQDTHRSHVEVLETIRDHRRALDEQARKSAEANKAGASAAKQQKGLIKDVADEIKGMAKGWVSTATAISTAKAAFFNYAEGERKLLVLQNRTKATTEEIRKQEQAMIAAARTSRTTLNETMDAATKMKAGLGGSMDDAIAKVTRLNVVAKGLGVIPQEFAEIVSDVMRTMDIPANQFNQTMEMVAGIVRETGVDINQLRGQSDLLGESAKSAGLKGREGFAEMGVELGIASKTLGNTTKGARTLSALMSELSSRSAGEAMNIPGERWVEELGKFKKEGGNAVVFAIGKFKQLQSEGARNRFLEKIGDRNKLLFSALLEKDNGSIAKQIGLIKELADGNRAVDEGRRVWESAAGSVDDLNTSISLLGDSFGNLMEVMGVPQIISMITKEFERLGKVVQWVNQLINWTSGKGPAPAIIGPHGFNPFQNPFRVLEDTGNALIGHGAPEEAKKRLDEALKRSEQGQAKGPPGTLPGLRTPGIPGYKPMSYTPGAGGGAGGASRGTYGSSTDALYLPADYRTGGGAAAGGGGGGGGGGAPAAGGGGAGPGGSTYGTGTGYAAPAATGGGSTGGMPVVPGAAQQGGGVPSAILTKAREVAAMGGPGAVDAFMRQAGYPKAGAWCGQFAAAVVKSSGGTPPANPQVASNWRNWGQQVATPEPGDIAVKIGSRFGGGRTATGATGSHVTMVSSVGQGTFAGLGGNQGGGRLTTSNFKQGAYEYFRGTPGAGATAGAAASAAASPGGFGFAGLNQGAYQQTFGGTKLQGQEAAIIQAAQKHNISPALLAGIIAHESGKGTSRFVNQLNNPAGIMDKATNWMKGKQFGSIGEGIDASARTIAKNLARGGGTIEGMGRLYAPPGAANDPRGLNSGWAAGVRGYVSRFGGGALGGGGVTDVSARARTGAPVLAAAPPTAGAGKSEQLRKMGFVYDPDTGQPLRAFDPYTGAKLATAGKEGVPGSAAGGVAPGISAERERREQEAHNKDVNRERQLRKEISDTQNAGIAGRKNKYGGEAAAQGGARPVMPSGEYIRTSPRTRGVGGEAAPLGGARSGRRYRLSRIGPRTKGVGGEAAPLGGMPEPADVAQARRFRELQEIEERRKSETDSEYRKNLNERSRAGGRLVGRPAQTEEEKADDAKKEADRQASGREARRTGAIMGGKDPDKAEAEHQEKVKAAAEEAAAEKRAAGGPVNAGQAYLVGERGPELFSSNTSGRITPNHSLGYNDAYMQFARTTLRRQADKEMREARWTSYSDIGCA